MEEKNNKTNTSEEQYLVESWGKAISLGFVAKETRNYGIYFNDEYELEVVVEDNEKTFNLLIDGDVFGTYKLGDYGEANDETKRKLLDAIKDDMIVGVYYYGGFTLSPRDEYWRDNTLVGYFNDGDNVGWACNYTIDDGESVVTLATSIDNKSREEVLKNMQANAKKIAEDYAADYLGDFTVKVSFDDWFLRIYRLRDEVLFDLDFKTVATAEYTAVYKEEED